LHEEKKTNAKSEIAQHVRGEWEKKDRTIGVMEGRLIACMRKGGGGRSEKRPQNRRHLNVAGSFA